MEMASGHGFWETLDVLIGREWRKPLKEDVVQDWVDRVVTKRQMTKAVSEENATQKSLKESEKSSGYGSESKKSDEEVVVNKTRQFVEPSVQCTYVSFLKGFLWHNMAHESFINMSYNMLISTFCVGVLEKSTHCTNSCFAHF